MSCFYNYMYLHVLLRHFCNLTYTHMPCILQFCCRFHFSTCFLSECSIFGRKHVQSNLIKLGCSYSLTLPYLTGKDLDWIFQMRYVIIKSINTIQITTTYRDEEDIVEEVGGATTCPTFHEKCRTFDGGIFVFVRYFLHFRFHIFV